MQEQEVAAPKMQYIADKELFKAVMYAISLIYKKYSTKEATLMAQKKYQQSVESITMELGKNFHLYPWLMQQREEYLKKVDSSSTSAISGETKEKSQPVLSLFQRGDQVSEDTPFRLIYKKYSDEEAALMAQKKNQPIESFTIDLLTPAISGETKQKLQSAVSSFQAQYQGSEDIPF